MDSKNYINMLTDSSKVGKLFGDYVIHCVTTSTIKPSNVTVLLSKINLNFPREF